MKKFLISFILMLTVLGASAEFRWGPVAGINISELYWKQDLVKTSVLPGPNVGVMGEIMIPGIGFGVDFALKYAMHGAQVDFGSRPIWGSEGYGNEKVWFQTLQLPVNLRFKWTRMDGLERTIAPFAYVGPVFSFNLVTSDLPIIEHPAGSVGLQFGIGGELFERFQVSAGYMWGLSYDIRTLKLDNFSGRTRGWQINFAWLF